MNLQRRLMILGLGGIGVFAAAFVWMWFLTYSRAVPVMERHVADHALSVLRELSPQLEVPLAAPNHAAIAALIDRVARRDGLAGVLVRDASGARVALAGSPPERWGPPLEPMASEATVSAWAPIVFEEIHLGSVAAVVSRKAVTDFARWMRVVLVVAVLLLALVTVATARVSRSFVAPMGRLMSFLERLARGEFEHRVETDAPGEWRNLAQYANATAAQLQARDALLHQRRRDLTESLERLRRSQEELMQSTRLASVGEMAGRAAHEILNPVTSVQGRLASMSASLDRACGAAVETFAVIVDGWREAYAKGGAAGLLATLQERPAEGAATLLDEDLGNLEQIRCFFSCACVRWSDDVKFLAREVSRIAHIVDGMRSLTRQSTSRTPVRARDIFIELVEIHHDSAAKRRIEVVVDCAEGVTILVDRYELVQVLTNLVHNAMHAIDASGRREGHRVTLSASADGDRVQLRVADTGSGVSPNHLPRMFESGFTTRPAAEGTGLGLSIARRLVRGFGGEITLERTEVGVGTTFLIELPLHTTAQPEARRVEGALHVHV